MVIALFRENQFSGTRSAQCVQRAFVVDGDAVASLQECFAAKRVLRRSLADLIDNTWRDWGLGVVNGGLATKHICGNQTQIRMIGI